MQDLQRRQFVARLAQTFLGVSALPLLRPAELLATSAAPQAKNVIYLFLSGAMSHLDTFDPKPGTDVQGETKAIKTKVPGLQLSQHLPQLAKQIDQLAIIRSLSTETGAHGPGRYLMRTSYKEIASTRHPGLGAWSGYELGVRNQDLPGNVVVGGESDHPGAGFLPAQFTPVPIGDPKLGLQNTKSPGYVDDDQFNRRMKLSNAFDRKFRSNFPNRDVAAYNQLYQDAIRLLKSKDLAAFDINQEKDDVKSRYGDNKLGQGCLLARRLVEHKVRFVEVVSGGWDNHRDLFTTLPTKAQELDQALNALLQDLKSSGLLKETLVVVATEFGRTPNINQNAGRDHHPGAFSCVLAGAGIRGGQAIGASDEQGFSVDDGHVSVADFNATICSVLGLPLDKEVRSPDGRPFKYAHDGTPIKEALT